MVCEKENKRILFAHTIFYNLHQTDDSAESVPL